MSQLPGSGPPTGAERALDGVLRSISGAIEGIAESVGSFFGPTVLHTTVSDHDVELELCLQLIAETDDAVEKETATRGSQPATRNKSSNGSIAVYNTSDAKWKTFYGKFRGGTVKATRVIDFEYEPNHTLERMYVFDDGQADRVVLHVHTFEPWPGQDVAERGDPTTRARKVTSVNFRHASKAQNPGRPAFLQEQKGFDLVNVRGWYDNFVKKGREKQLEWHWVIDGDVPACMKNEARIDQVREAYNQVDPLSALQLRRPEAVAAPAPTSAFVSERSAVGLIGSRAG
jgi:hypothetical protein